MFNPVRYYQKRLEIKRNVFNPDKKTLNLQALNRFVNGKPEKQRTAPTYLRAKTRDLLWKTVVEEWRDGKYGKDLDQVANSLILWCQSPDRAQNANVRHWLKQLANAQPVERPADEQVKKAPSFNNKLIEDLGDGVSSHVSSADDAQSHRTSEETFDWSAARDETTNGIKPVIPNDVGSGTEGVAKRDNDSNDLFEWVDAKIENKNQRPGRMLRPEQESTKSRDHRVMHLLDNGQIVPAKQ